MFATSSLLAQEASDPRAVQPERPTVATHAWTVAPGFLELETGGEWDANRDHTHAFSTPSELKIGLAPHTQVAVQTSPIRPPGQSVGVGDVAVVLKHRWAERLPVIGGFAVLTGLKLPTGDASHGTTTTDVSLLLISSHRWGDASLDVNVGVTHRSGDGTRAPQWASVWTVSGAVPISGSLGWTAEIFGYPETRGPAGASATAAILTGPTMDLGSRAVLDCGGIIHLRGSQPDALYAGLVWNLGHL